jgi:hypothetical protein
MADDFALAAQEAQLAGRLGLGQVAGRQPLRSARMERAAGPCGGRDGRSTDQHFAVIAELDLAAGKRLADGSLRDVEGMVERDEGGGFGHAVALHDDQANGIPECLDRLRQRAPAGDERPELEAQGAVHVAEAPPAAQSVASLGRGSARRRRCLRGRGGDACREAGQRGFQMSLQQGVDAGNGGQHGDAFAANGLDEPGGDEAAFKVQFSAIDGRHPQTHGLAEDVAQGQRVQNAQRMHHALVAEVGLRGSLDGLKAGQHVAVGEDDAFGIAGGAGGEQDLQLRLGAEAGHGAERRVGQGRGPVLKGHAGDADRQLIDEDEIAYGHLGRDIGGDAGSEVGGAGGVQRNGENAAQQAAMKGGDPLRAVVGPDEHAVALHDAAAIQEGGKAAG